ncbi:hypothetical protein, partial [Mesorhizobium sp.]|uniref:hypothetical protein n=1 Tax=Mesorhizobium sp. TaxID=1871066 RepID=UPI0025D4042C
TVSYTRPSPARRPSSEAYQLPHTASDRASSYPKRHYFKTSSSKHHKAQVRASAVVLNIIKQLAKKFALPSLR